jgi:hypothetical protein
MTGKEKEVKKVANPKLRLNELVKASGERYFVIMGALIEGGLQKDVEEQQSLIRQGSEDKGIITKTELKKMITTFKEKKLE